MTRKYVAIIPAAGLGTRFLPITRAVPKELLPIGRKPALHFILEELAQAKIFDVVMVIRPEKELLRSYCAANDIGYDLHVKSSTEVKNLQTFMKQFRFRWVMQDTPKGLGHAVLCAAKALPGAWPVIMLPDMIVDHTPNCVEQLCAVSKSTNRAVIATHRVPKDQLSKYGVLAVHPTSTPSLSTVVNIIEKPSIEKAPSDLVVTGRYLLPPSIFGDLEETGRGQGGEIQLTDALNTLAAREGLDALEYSGVTLDTGDPEGWLAANLHFSQKQPGSL